MKKFTFLLVFSLICFEGFSQKFGKGDKIANLGLGVGWYGIGAVGMAEVGLGDGIGVGAVVGVSRDASYGYLGSNYGVTYVSAGGRASYHLGEILEKSGVKVDKLDPYLGIAAGIRFAAGNYTWLNRFGLMYGGHAGIRYALKEKMSVYVEAGVPFTSGGISFNF